MKKIIALFLAFSFMMAMGSFAQAEEKGAWEADGVLRILGIGNSYTEDTTYKMGEVIKHLGIENFELAFIFIGGCTVNQHLANLEGNKADYGLYTYENGAWKTRQNVSIREALAMSDWDFITLQEQSFRSSVDYMMGDVERWAREIHQLEPNAALAWNMTWAYPAEYASADFASIYSKDTQAMYEGILNAAEKRIAPIECIDLIIPNGTAIQNARQSYLGDNHSYLFRDKLHLSFSEGRYIVAMNTVATLLGADMSVMRDFFRDEKFANVAIESVMHAQENPFAVTPTQYPTAMDRTAMKNRYAVQCADFYGEDGGWLHNIRNSYNWLSRDDYARKYGIIFGNGEKGAEISITLPENGKTEILYMMTQTVSLPETVMIGHAGIQLNVSAGFSGSISLTLASGQNMNLKNSVSWKIAGSDLQEGWNELQLLFDDAQQSGYFDEKNFKVMQIIAEGNPGDTVRISNLYLDGNW